jgi:hypothetical protein
VLRLRRFVLKHVLHTNDTPHAIALGTSLAMFVAFLPLIGLQTVISMGLAALLRANKAVCIPIVWLTNPVTAPPIFFGCFLLGRAVLGGDGTGDADAVLARLEAKPAATFWQPAYWYDWIAKLWQVGLELWVGSLIVATVLAVASYFAARRGVVAYRHHRHLRIQRRHQHRAKRRSAILVRQSEAA